MLRVNIEFPLIMKMQFPGISVLINGETTFEIFQRTVFTKTWQQSRKYCPYHPQHGEPKQITFFDLHGEVKTMQDIWKRACDGLVKLNAMFEKSKEAKEKNIIIYGGHGADALCAEQTMFVFASLFGSQYGVKLVDENYLKKEPWEERTVLLVMPGGEDCKYMEAMRGDTNQRIQNFVFNGGKYLGICAGAYYAGKSIVYAPNTPEEIIADRELQFFPETITGPHLAPFDCEAKSGARSAKILFGEETLPLYYHGGCSFPKSDLVEEIATYETGESAIVSCAVGKGRALLSGVHFEISPFALNEEQFPQLTAIKSELIQNNRGRLSLIKEMLFPENFWD